MTDEELANLCITLINQATYMLRRLIDKQQKMFLQNGGVKGTDDKSEVEVEEREWGMNGG